MNEMKKSGAVCMALHCDNTLKDVFPIHMYIPFCIYSYIPNVKTFIF